MTFDAVVRLEVSRCRQAAHRALKSGAPRSSSTRVTHSRRQKPATVDNSQVFAQVRLASFPRFSCLRAARRLGRLRVPQCLRNRFVGRHRAPLLPRAVEAGCIGECCTGSGDMSIVRLALAGRERCADILTESLHRAPQACRAAGLAENRCKLSDPFYRRGNSRSVAKLAVDRQALFVQFLRGNMIGSSDGEMTELVQ